jgi:polyphosphate kinase 2 (PPK2 family)
VRHLPAAGEIVFFDLLEKSDAYTAAKVTMFQHTDRPESPWTVIRSNGNKRARVEAMRRLLSGIDYDARTRRSRAGRPAGDIVIRVGSKAARLRSITGRSLL